MLDDLFANYLLVTIIILIVWVASMIIYLYASNQHKALENELETLHHLLDEEPQDSA